MYDAFLFGWCLSCIFAYVRLEAVMGGLTTLYICCRLPTFSFLLTWLLGMRSGTPFFGRYHHSNIPKVLSLRWFVFA